MKTSIKLLLLLEFLAIFINLLYNELAQSVRVWFVSNLGTKVTSQGRTAED